MQQTAAPANSALFRDVTWLAHRWGVNRYSIYRMASRGEVQLIRIGGRYKIHVQEVDRIERAKGAGSVASAWKTR